MNELATAARWTDRDPGPAVESYHIEATRSLVDRPLRTLKHDDLFGVFNSQGDCAGGDDGPDGLYYKDTRFLSGLMLRLEGAPLLLLGSVILDDNGALIVDLTNPDLDRPDGAPWLQRDALFASRLKFLCGNTCYERILLRRYEALDRPFRLQLSFDADFADLFEVRGEERPARGRVAARVVDGRTVRFRYRGLDDCARSTSLYFDPPPARLAEHEAEWEIDLTREDRCAIVVKAACAIGRPVIAEPPSHLVAFRALRRSTRHRMERIGGIATSNELVNEVIDRSAADVEMLLTSTEYGLYPYAGVPWYSTIFGRDGILTAMQLLWAAPAVARGVLTALALTQAKAEDPAADAEPGKIVHEMRDGEMARLGEVPFRRYYGSVDATPLFVWLAGEYLKRSGDLETIRRIWPNLVAALDWIDGPGDPDGDGFVEYRRATERGLANQGWKDSWDSIFHADGRLAEGPIALCEVQAYAFAARRAAAEIARALGEDDRAGRLERDAEALRVRFEEAFWLDDLGSYALALDGAKRPCRVLSSNAGHALFAGIAAPDRAARVAERLLGSRFFTGWGVRTIASGEARYNPMSYHNGSVWPHDNALIALGLARYGHKREAARIFDGLIEAGFYFEFRRLPELFCGFSRRRKRGPTSYPVACAPQAWAAAAPYALIQAVTGLELDHGSGACRLRNPVLPLAFDEITLPRLKVGDSVLHLQLCRSGGDVTTTVISREGGADLVILK